MTITMDKKGRLVLPKKYRARLGLEKGGRLEVEVEGGGILLKAKRKITAHNLYGIAKMGNVRLEDIENASGRDSLT